MLNKNRTDQILSIRQHNDFIAGSFSINSSAAAADLNEFMKKKLKKLAEWVLDNQGIIGHIKASIEYPGSVKMYSITEDEVFIKERLDNCNTVSVAVIAAFVDKEEIRRQLETCLEEVRMLENYSDGSKEQSS